MRVCYDFDTDLFGIVSNTDNTFITGNIASLVDYLDIYYLKWLGIDKIVQNLIRLQVLLDSDGKPLRDAPYKDPYPVFDETRDIGLSENYDTSQW